jgi:hypothetical protein
MASGRLALVPASTQRGDIIAPISGRGYYSPHHYLFHPLRAVDKRASMDDEILKSMYTLLLDHKKRMDPEKWSTMHSEFVGECFLDETKSLGSSEFHNDSNTIIIALH